jgi:hypothetical protein
MTRKKTTLIGYDGYVKDSNGKWVFVDHYKPDELEECKQRCKKCKPRFSRGG